MKPADDRSSGARSSTVAVLAPTGRDAQITKRLLSDASIDAVVTNDIGALCEAMASGIGAIVLAEEALTSSARTRLLDALAAQPSWSDLAIVIIAAEGELQSGPSPAVSALAQRGSVMILERPVRVATLVTTLASALRARQRQYDVRDYLEERRATEAMLLENENLLRKAVDEAEGANRAKSEFLAVMSHELRTPLNAIAGYCDLLLAGVYGSVTPTQREALDRIALSERHLLALINDVLNLAKIEAGRLHVVPAPVDVCALAESLDPFIGPQVLAKQQSYEKVLPEGPVIATADPDKAGQVVLNLLSNAVKFTPAGGSICLEIRRGSNVIEICVMDNGPGIPADRLEEIFEPFVQIRRSTASPQEGTGLGLAISRDLARLMGGDLAAKNRPEGGASFSFTLPAGDPANPPPVAQYG